MKRLLDIDDAVLDALRAGAATDELHDSHREALAGLLGQLDSRPPSRTAGLRRTGQTSDSWVTACDRFYIDRVSPGGDWVVSLAGSTKDVFAATSDAQALNGKGFARRRDAARACQAVSAAYDADIPAGLDTVGAYRDRSDWVTSDGRFRVKSHDAGKYWRVDSNDFEGNIWPIVARQHLRRDFPSASAALRAITVAMWRENNPRPA